MNPLIVGILMLAIADSVHAAKHPAPDKTVTYKTVADNEGKDTELKLQIFTPPDFKPSDQRPAIVFFFGGGWIGGAPGQFYPHCEYFASRGMVAISAEYRVKNVHGTSPRECVKDGKSAVRWIRQHAHELGIDPNRLAAGGGSAGGHVAAATGTTQGLNEEGEDQGISCRPNALLLFNPVLDNGPEGYGHDRVKEYWQEFSPLHNIDENTPPTVIFLGTKDKLIPVSTVEKYKKLMADKGCRCDLHLYQDQEHGFFNFKNTKYFTETVVEADRFLASLGYLTGEPTLPKEPEDADDGK